VPKRPRMFRLNPELYERFKSLVGVSGYTVTGALEKFMGCCVENGALQFPGRAADEEGLEAEARIMLALMAQRRYWYHLRSEEENLSVEGRLLQLLQKISDSTLKKQIEETLKTP